MARLIFDLDGTLVDSLPAMLASANRMLTEFGRAPVSPETCSDFVGRGVRVLVTRLLEHTGGLPGGDVEPALARYHAIYGADPVTGTTVYPGARRALMALAAAGHGLAVCTQKPSGPARDILTSLALMPPVSGLTCGDSLDVLKPDPRMFAHAAEQLPPGEAVVIGDGLADAQLAAAAGVPFLLRMGGYGEQPRSDVPVAGRFTHFDELPELVARVASARVVS
ncbi:HAD hydrolase-like protein [Amaricoccus solimangrovi]|nr:HAD family hydrolase [Amaricoccus solimangrovi]